MEGYGENVVLIAIGRGPPPRNKIGNAAALPFAASSLSRFRDLSWRAARKHRVERGHHGPRLRVAPASKMKKS